MHIIGSNFHEIKNTFKVFWYIFHDDISNSCTEIEVCYTFVKKKYFLLYLRTFFIHLVAIVPMLNGLQMTLSNILHINAVSLLYEFANIV